MLANVAYSNVRRVHRLKEAAQTEQTAGHRRIAAKYAVL
jgi:hypothetical protein